MRTELTAQTFEAMRGLHMLGAVSGLMVVGVLWEQVPLPLLLAWLSLVIAAGSYTGLVIRAYLRPRTKPHDAHSWIRRLGRAHLMASAAWGASAVFLSWPLPSHLQIFIGILLVGSCAVTLGPLSAFYRLWIVCTLAACLPIIAALVLTPPLIDESSLAGLLGLAVILYCSRLSRRAYRSRVAGLRGVFARNGLTRQLRYERSRRHAIQRRLARAGDFDTVTGLPNQRQFLLRVQNRLEEQRAAPPHGRKDLIVLLIDLDSFTEVNNNFGRAAGDYLLARVGARLKAALPSAVGLARMGNDEFAVAVPALPLERDLGPLVARVRECVEQPIMWDEVEIVMTATIGSSRAPEHGPDIETVLKKADLALRQAKQSRTDKHLFFQPQMENGSSNRFALQHALRRALPRSELSIAYQPVVNLQHGEVVAAEALLRWNSPEFGAVSPVEFIPLAEQTGLIDEIGAWVLNQACHDAVLWQARRANGFGISVNVSVNQLINPAFPGVVEQALQRSGLPAHALRLEITESMVMTDPEGVLGLLEQIRALGVRVALDDFGTGYSSLSYLTQLNIDYLKLDKGLIRDISSSERAIAIARSTLALAGALNLWVVAEGIETAADWERLRVEGCRFGQGFYFSRPVDRDTFDRLPPYLGRRGAATPRA